MNTVEHVDQLISIVDELITLLTGENEALYRLRPLDVAAPADRKAELMHAYAAHYQALRADPGSLRNVPQGRKRHLADRTRRLDSLTAENVHLVRTVATLRQRAVADILASTNAPGTPLQRLAPDGRAAPRPKSPPSPATFDRRL